jgi:hypothetical protein
VKRAKAKRAQKLALEAQNGSSRPSRETSSLRQEDQPPQTLSVALQRRQKTAKRTENIRHNYGQGQEMVPSPARSEASKATQAHWQAKYPGAAAIQSSATGVSPSQDPREGASQSSSINPGRTNAQVSGLSGGLEITAAPSLTLEQRGAGILDPGSSMGYLSDPRTRSTDESRNTTSTPATSTEARPSDQEEHQANEAIRQEAPKSRRRFFKFWKRTKPTHNGQNETG